MGTVSDALIYFAEKYGKGILKIGQKFVWVLTPLANIEALICFRRNGTPIGNILLTLTEQIHAKVVNLFQYIVCI